jgi:class 3 adenylate cyclase
MEADPKAAAEVWAAFEHQYRTLGARDFAAHMRCWAPDADVIEIGSAADEVCIGHAQIESMNVRALAEAPAELIREALESSTPIDLHWHTISREGPVAWITGEGAFRVVAEGREIRDPFRWTMIFVLREGTWLIVNSHFSVPDQRVAEGRAWPTYIDTVASEVRREEPDLAAQTGLDGTVTLLFSDIEESTPIAERLGDLRWMQVLREHNALVRECVTRHSGLEVKTIGDAFMVAFSSARRAVLCAIDLERAFAAYNREHHDSQLLIRIGLHAGEPVREGGDFFGKSVTLASRIAAQARGGEILASALVRELVEASGDIVLGEVRAARLKGFAEEQRLCDVPWRL